MPFLILVLFFAAFASAQQRQRVAVLPSVGEMKPQELELLTAKVREIASKVLPSSEFLLLRQDAVISAIGGEEEFFIACKEGTCIGELAKKANANYGARCDVLKVGGDLALKFELYSVGDEAILETFVDYKVKDFHGMLAVLEEKLPEAFKKLKRFFVNLSSDPSGASLSFDGVSVGGCLKTPCRLELAEGDVAILAALEQYETADTTVFIKQNNQSIGIKLLPNFGVLEIKPAYIDGIGGDESWSLLINGLPSSSWENKLSPGDYDVRLAHGCYDDVSFMAGISNGSREVFDMSSYVKLKMGGSAPVCSKIELELAQEPEAPAAAKSAGEEGESRKRKIVSFGFRAGFNYSHSYDKYDKFEIKTGFNGGFVLDIAASDWLHFQPGIMYVFKGGHPNKDKGDDYIEFPVMVSLKLSVLRLNAGPYFSPSAGLSSGWGYGFGRGSGWGLSYGFGFDIGDFYLGMFYDYGIEGGIRWYKNRALGFNLGYNL